MLHPHLLILGQCVRVCEPGGSSAAARGSLLVGSRLGGLKAGDALHTTTTRQTANRGLGDALDVVAQDFAVALCAACVG